MHVVIMGCGRSGSRLAINLDKRGHEVAVIDKDPTTFKYLGPDFGGRTVTGIGFDREVLLRAGIEEADAFIAVSSGDNSNIVASRVAKTDFRVPKVITRIYDPRRAMIYRGMGIPTVAPVTWGINKITDILLRDMTYTRQTFGNGEVELVEFEISSNLAGRRISEFEAPGEINIACIERLGEAFIPMAGTILAEGDIVQIVVLKDSLDKLNKMFFLV